MYYPDLSPADERTVEQFRMRSWENFDLELPVLYVGWLDEGQPYPQGVASSQFVEALRELCRNPVAEWKGHHTCPFCAWQSGERNAEAPSSNADIEAIGEEAVYYAPGLILHYVESHDYLPPQGFIDAVLAVKEKAQTPPVSHRGRIRGKEDDYQGDLLSHNSWGHDFWKWPIEENPNAEGLIECVNIFRYELVALAVQIELHSRGRTATVGEMNLAEWIEGKVNLKMGELGETNPGHVFPRLSFAFYLQTLSNRRELLECLVGASDILYEILSDARSGTGHNMETWLAILRESARSSKKPSLRKTFLNEQTF